MTQQFTGMGLRVTKDNGPWETEAHHGPSLLPWEGFQAEVLKGETQIGLSQLSELRRQSQKCRGTKATSAHRTEYQRGESHT